MRAAIVVLGDVARSPRMQYHAAALASHDVAVDVIGYVETPLPPALAEDSRIVVHALRGQSQSARQHRAWWAMAAGARGFALCWQLTAALLWRIRAPDLVLVQNPPGVPALLIAWVAARVRGARFVIDWHNLTHSMLALRLGERSVLVGAVERFERAFGRRADGNLFVSSAMRESLLRQWGVRGVVVRDRPAAVFTALAAEARADIRRMLCERLALPWAPDGFGLVVSSTSWTADEDFDLLLDAVDRCDATAPADPAIAGLAPVLVLVTGRGPLRERYEQRLATRRPARFHVRTAWLEPDLYPRVLGAADVGVCLHRSTSGLDLPMKVLDFFGAGLPVCALDYGPCLGELVRDGENGFLFETSDDLARLLGGIFDRAPDRIDMDRLRQGVAAARAVRWEESWEDSARPVLLPGWPRTGQATSHAPA